jgi:hypothetical protein
MNEFCIVCALPHSLAADAGFHVSLFFAPTIRPPAPTTLDDSELFLEWAQTLSADLELQLLDQDGDIECEPLLAPVDPELWRAYFPPETPVASFTVPRWEQRKWRSFDARQVHDIARNLHMATMVVDPTRKPRPDDHPLTDLMFGQLRGIERAKLQLPMPDERRTTAQLDDIVESGRPLAAVLDQIASEQNPLRRMLLELHRCRRFYERPESQEEYRSRPNPKAKVPKVKLARSEFHERCAAAGDHGELLRRLGLVVDVRVADPRRLRRSQWLAARISLDGDRSAFRCPRQRCHAVGDALVSTPSGADWADGALRIGDAQRFSVLTLDTDGSALKAERFVMTLPRLLRAETNSDPVNAATPALRSPGFTVTSTRQALTIQESLQRQRLLESAFDNAGTPELFTEDVARGFRVEVWDDHTRRWASLHHRLASANVVGFGDVYAELPEQGFSQGASTHETPDVNNSPIHVHEALFGWEGWSLSAPRPGKPISNLGADRAEGPQEEVEVDDDDLVHPLRIKTQSANGTLPRLRYGRSYAFRAWAVDLAGNSRPHDMKGNPFASPAPAGAGDPATAAGASHSAWSSVALRDATLQVLRRRAVTDIAPLPAPVDAVALVLEDPVVGPPITQYLRTSLQARGELRVAQTRVDVSRRALVNAGIERAVSDLSRPFVRETAGQPPSAICSPLHPFLRWEPVSSPVLVPRTRYTEGESLGVLVIRSGVTQDPVTLELTVTPPDEYADEANLIVVDANYLPVNERHLAPPKVSQMTSELHGMFDLAIGSDKAANQRKMLGWALRENGTFRDSTRADIDSPPDRLPQPGIALVHVGTPTEELPDLEDLDPGEPLAPGQTVVHDVDELALPYLPDPLARGISLAFPEAAQDRSIPFPFGGEGFTAAYPGTWPEIEPFRLQLNGGPQLDGRLAGRVLELTLPPGDTQVLQLASSLRRDDLRLMGPWRSLPDTAQNDPDVAEAAADGLLWGLTPPIDVRLIHAVNRPLKVPRPIRLIPMRGENDTHLNLIGAVEVHGPSTDTLTAEASWTDDVDDVTRPGPHQATTNTKAFDTRVLPYEELALLSNLDGEITTLQEGKLAAHKARHEVGDTRHHRVDYRFRASTRFREFFPPALLPPADDPKSPLDGHSVIAHAVQVSVNSTAPPAAPVVNSVIPLFRWSHVTEPEQPMSYRHVRRAGVRIYLERPWWSSGNGELLGVLLAPGGNDAFGPPQEDQSGFPFVSKWGADPIWLAAPVDNRALPSARLESFLRMLDLDDRAAPARPVMAPANYTLRSAAGNQQVTVLGYQPMYNEDRKLWYADIAVEPGDNFWPFLRLAVCRYQPNSINGCHLSAPVRCDFVQLPPERTTSVSRTDDRHVRIVVAGPVGRRAGLQEAADPVRSLAAAVDQNRGLVARLQRRIPEIDSDLGWETVAATRLALRGRGVDDKHAAWVGEIEAGVKIPLARPESDKSKWRVAVEEWERLESDPDALTGARQWESRLTYADSFDL